jgi:hypothetical protein
MKKALVAALAASFLLTTAGSVFAAQPEFDGKIQYQHRFNQVDGVSSDENRLKFVLNGHADAIAKNMNLYFRISAEKLGGSAAQTARSFNGFPGQSWSDTSAVGFFDQFGVEVKNAGWNYKVGRQDAFIGANGLIYDSTYGIGRHIFADGVTVTGKSGVTNISAVALQLDQYNEDDSKLYALAASYKPSKNLTLGATLAKYNKGNGGDVTPDANFWDVNVAYTFNSKLDGYAEYAKSNLDTDNTAYVLGLNYSLDKKNFLWTCYSSVEKFANIHDGMSTTTYDHNREGMWYGFGHTFDKTTSFALYYGDMKKIDPAVGPVPGSKNHKSLRTTVNYKF